MGSCVNLANLLIFVYLFCAASFNYYLVNFYLKYIPGDIFANSIVASLAESTAHWLSGWIVIKIGPVNGICASFSLAGVAGAALWLCDANGVSDLIPEIVLAAKFGAGAAFAMLYMSTLHYFPNRFLGRVFGTCNVTARFATIFAPMIAEAADPTPEAVMVTTCFLAAILSRFL